MVRNPYDRRDPPRSHDHSGYVSLGYATDILDDGRRCYQGFGLARLEELLRDEFARGYNAGEGTMERKTEEEILPRAQRTAWDEGQRAGVEAGRAELLQEIASAYESRVHSTLEKLEHALEDPDVPHGELTAAAREARELLSALTHSHHQGFRELPF